jgi:hypothetical protein
MVSVAGDVVAVAYWNVSHRLPGEGHEVRPEFERGMSEIRRSIADVIYSRAARTVFSIWNRNYVRSRANKHRLVVLY